MAHTIINQFAIVSAQSQLTAQLNDNLCPEAEPAVLLLAQLYESNCFPQDPKWHVLFVGTTEEFKNGYLDQLGAMFDNRVIRGRRGVIRSTAHIRTMLLNLLNEAEPLSVGALRERGIEAYTWNADEAALLHITHSSDVGLVPQAYQSPPRYGYELATLADAQRMVDQTLALAIHHSRQPDSATPELLMRNRPFPTRATNLKSRMTY